MKKLLLFIFVFSVFRLAAQIPNDYYDSAQGLTGYDLKNELHDIISTGHNPKSYDDLWTVFKTSDDDRYYEGDGTVLDIYSENPNGQDPYEFVFGTEQCGNYQGEGDCYNREHLMPKSWFDDQKPMYTDIHHIFPTDGRVNGVHGNLPFGEAGNANYTSSNGSKRGNNILQGYNGEVFEPIDEFKGDVARAYFYMATRYQNKIPSWENNATGSKHTFNGTTTQVFEDWVVKMLVRWHGNDPVSQREKDRNDDVYNFQGNANPYISHPEYVTMIWDTAALSVATVPSIEFKTYPNPVSNGILHIKTSEKNLRIKVFSLTGKLILKRQLPFGDSKVNLSELSSGLYLLKLIGKNGVAIRKVVKQ